MAPVILILFKATTEAVGPRTPSVLVLLRSLYQRILFNFLDQESEVVWTPFLNGNQFLACSFSPFGNVGQAAGIGGEDFEHTIDAHFFIVCMDFMMGMGQERPRASNFLWILVILHNTSSFTSASEGRHKVTSRHIESSFFIDFRPGGGMTLLVPEIRAPFQALDVLEPRFVQYLDGDQGHSASWAHGHYLLLFE